MRRLILIVMIVLLPLRSWAGDLMGVEMAMSGTVPVLASAMPADCPMLAAGTAEADGGKTPPGMGCCTSCELCIPFTELMSSKLDVVTFAAHAKPLTGLADFQSAAPAPTLKPPIS